MNVTIMKTGFFRCGAVYDTILNSTAFDKEIVISQLRFVNVFFIVSAISHVFS